MENVQRTSIEHSCMFPGSLLTDQPLHTWSVADMYNEALGARVWAWGTFTEVYTIHESQQWKGLFKTVIQALPHFENHWVVEIVAWSKEK